MTEGGLSRGLDMIILKYFHFMSWM